MCRLDGSPSEGLVSEKSVEPRLLRLFVYIVRTRLLETADISCSSADVTASTAGGRGRTADRRPAVL